MADVTSAPVPAKVEPYIPASTSLPELTVGVVILGSLLSMILAGAIILILSMANALINFVVNEKIPGRLLDAMLGLGLTERWQFLLILNVFLLVLGMLMEGFSAILVAVPLILPFAARFNLQPFHLAIMFLVPEPRKLALRVLQFGDQRLNLAATHSGRIRLERPPMFLQAIEGNRS